MVVGLVRKPGWVVRCTPVGLVSSGLNGNRGRLVGDVVTVVR